MVQPPPQWAQVVPSQPMVQQQQQPSAPLE
jgi:hypothetical protein